MKELSRLSGVSVPSIKYYLREGMLPVGKLTAPNQANYDETHLRRLRFIRALLGVGGQTVADTRVMLAAVDADGDPVNVLGAALLAKAPRAPDGGADAASIKAREIVADLAEQRGWHVTKENSGLSTMVDIVASFIRLERLEVVSLLDSYADLMETLVGLEVRAACGSAIVVGESDQLAESLVISAVLGGSLLRAVRNVAYANVSSSVLGQR